MASKIEKVVPACQPVETRAAELLETHLRSLLQCDSAFADLDVCFWRRLKEQIIDCDPLLMKIYQKSKTRSLKDKKVPPGSDLVKRSIADTRYCLCLLCIAIGKYTENIGHATPEVLSLYKEALIWYPYSIEAGRLLGQCLRHEAGSEDDLNYLQFLWERSLNSTNEMEDKLNNPKAGNESSSATCAPTIMIQLLAESEPTWSFDFNESKKWKALVNRLDEIILFNEREAAKNLQDALILFYCQEGPVEKAYPLLKRRRFQWKLSQEVLRYSGGVENCLKDASIEARKDCPYVFCCDSILPEQYLNRLKHIFRPSSPFWREHHYDFYSNCSRQVGYFSYLYPLKTRSANNLIEQVIDIVYATLLAQLEDAKLDRGDKNSCLESLRSEATQAEWWVHSRPHSSGHQFHYDSDETALYGGETAQHPIASCVIYLSEGVGGPTVITNQTLNSTSFASYGLVCYPSENRMVMFDAKFLHGVVPGRGVCSLQNPSDGIEKLCPDRRLSFMVGFWKDIKAKDRGPGCPGPGQPFPSMRNGKCAEGYTWPEEVIDMIQLPSSVKDIHRFSSGCKIRPGFVRPIWEPVDPRSDVDIETNCAHYSTCFQGF